MFANIQDANGSFYELTEQILKYLLTINLGEGFQN